MRGQRHKNLHKGVVSQELVLSLNNTKIDMQPEANLSKDTTRLLKGFATAMVVNTSRLRVQQSLETPIKRYATWFLNEIHKPSV